MKRIESDQDFPDSPIHGVGRAALRQAAVHARRAHARSWSRAFIDRAVSWACRCAPTSTCPEPLGRLRVALQHQGWQAAVHARSPTSTWRAAGRTCASSPRPRRSSSSLDGRRVDGVVYEQDGQTHTRRGRQGRAQRGRLPHAAAPHALRHRARRRAGAAGHQGGARPGGRRRELPGPRRRLHDLRGPDAVQEDWVVPRFRLIIKSDPSRPAATSTSSCARPPRCRASSG